MKTIFVGDPHVQVSNLKDSEKLRDFILDTVKKEKVETLVFLGDLFHTHAVIRLEVEKYWHNFMSKLEKDFPDLVVYILVGNHDMILGNSKYAGTNSIEPLGKYENIYVVDSPKAMDGIKGIGLVPYYQDHAKLLKDSKQLYEDGCEETLIAHQTFTGSQYENGFYAQDAIDPELISQNNIISGHIHKEQTIGKCWYTGTAKWDTMSDANHEKGIWLVNFEKSGKIKDKTFLSTKEVVTPILKINLEEGDDLPEIDENARVFIEAKGKNAWLKKVKKKYKGKANLKTKSTDRKIVKTKSEKLSIFEHLEKKFKPIDGVDKKDLKEYLSQKVVA